VAPYRRFVFDQTGTRPGSKTIRAESDILAKRIAMDLLRDDPLIERMEVWRDADIAFRLSRNQARLEGGRGRQHFMKIILRSSTLPG
jgi:hypothetical protein